jgi:hypothetical protein
MTSGWAANLVDFFTTEPLMAIAITAALIAFASTPIAFAVLGRQDWFKARRGRVMQRPEFSSIVCAMMLVMGIPAIFLALAVKSRYFDKDRYEFDPNKTWSVLEQGRGFRSVQEADKAVKEQMALLAEERKNLVENVKKLDEAMIKLRAVAGTSPAVAQTVPDVLQRLAGVRRSVGLDGPQQLMDFTAPPVELANVPAPSAVPVSVAPPVLDPTTSRSTAAAPAASSANGLPKAVIDAELAAVPEPQRPLASFLPLTEIPPGWVVGKSGDKYIETFNADNLFEKIDGRAESFIQYDVKGMAYTYYHPAGDPSNEVQLYIFQMGDTLKALGKYGSEKPEEAKLISLGSEGYTSAGSTLFYEGPYYTQIVSTQDDPKFAAFALDLARRVAAKQASVGGSAASPKAGETARLTAKQIFEKLPPGPSRSGPKFVAEDVFGYSFLTDVFMADYEEGKVTWQGFIRVYNTSADAKKVFEQYVESAKRDGGTVKTVQAEGADQFVVSANVGLVDAIFLKGNMIGGANGASEAPAAETFARGFVKSLPAKLPMVENTK